MHHPFVTIQATALSLLNGMNAEMVRKQNIKGNCVVCGRPNDRYPNRKSCSFCMERVRKWRSVPQNKMRERGNFKRRYLIDKRRMIKASSKHAWNIKIKVFKLISPNPKCARCGIDDLRLLTLNHLNGDGTKERSSIVGQKTRVFYKSILKGERRIDDLNILCYNCNILYEYDRERRYAPDGYDGGVQEWR